MPRGKTPEEAREIGKLGGRPEGSGNEFKAKVAREALEQLGGAQVFVKLYQETKDEALRFRIATFLYEQSHGRAAEQQSADDPDRAAKIVIGLPRNTSVTVSRGDHDKNIN